MKRTMTLAAFAALLTSCQPAPAPAPNAQPAPTVPADPNFIFDYPMVAVPGGTFQMGATNVKKGADPDECVHEVTVADFQMGIYEVNQLQWEIVMNTRPSGFRNCDLCPVENISWFEVQKFIEALNRLTGRRYRLPTEEEWEYAARGGAQGVGKNLLYAGTDKLKSIAWYDENAGKKTHPVGTKAPNELGMYDLCGNVREWCESRFLIYPGCTPNISMSGRACRGGSWFSTWFGCRISERMGVEPGSHFKNLGFRLASDAPAAQ